ncbi:MAG: zf-HC2 domain-containing protein [Gemmatimonadota bacterium]
MLSCKDATRLISQSMDVTLPVGQRIGLRLHLLICKFCLRYRRQLLVIREALRDFDAAAVRPGGRAGETLSEDARERIRKSLQAP